jgi:acetyltransferase
VDVLGDATIERYTTAMNLCLQDPGVDAILMIYTPQGPAVPIELAKATAAIAEKSAKPIIATWMGGRTIQEAMTVLARNNVPAYTTPEEAVKTYFYMYRYARNLELLYETPADLPIDQALQKTT